MNANYQTGEQKPHEENVFNYKMITYVDDMKKQMNFSFLQSLALCAAFITGMNKESQDIRLFDKTQKSKPRNQANKEGQPALVGKSKRFTLERFCAILDYLISTQAEDSQENIMHGHSLEYFATINSLVSEGLLKKYVMKRGAVGDSNAAGTVSEDLTSISYKCNFDQTYAEGVAAKIGFLLHEYLDSEQKNREE